jgi:hypothetical protein
VATDDDGLWLLRSLRPLRWLQLAQRDGLPDDRLLHVVLDDSANAWVATRAGLARITPQLQIDSWPQDILLSQRALALWKGPSSHVYVGWWGGLFRIVTRPYDDVSAANGPSTWVRRISAAGSDTPVTEQLPGIHAPIVSTAWAGALWWTAGDSLTSFLGTSLQPPSCPRCGLGTGSRFQAAEQGPHGAVHLRAVQARDARSGGSAGLRESTDSGRRRTTLRCGASATRSASVATEAHPNAARCFVARRQGGRLRVRIPSLEAHDLKLVDVRGRFVGTWSRVGPGIFAGNRRTPRAQSLRPGIYFAPGSVREGHRVRVLIPR